MQTITLAQVKNGAVLPAPKYKSDPYVIISNEGIVLFAGTLSETQSLSFYYDDCEVKVREYDLYMRIILL